MGARDEPRVELGSHPSTQIDAGVGSLARLLWVGWGCMQKHWHGGSPARAPTCVQSVDVDHGQD